MSYLRTIIKKAGTIIGVRRRVNFIEGSNITLTIADDSVTDEVDITISSPVNGLLLYYFQNTASDVATYYAALNTPYTPSTALATIVGVTNGQVLYNFITAAASPGLTFIPAGLLQVNLHAYQSGGTKDIVLYAQIWETNSAGVDIGKICDTGNSIILTGVDADLYITYNLASPYTLTSSASRIDCRIIATVTGGGSAPDVVFSVGGVTDSRLAIPNNIAAGGSGVSDGDKGDITVSGGGATWTIDTGLAATKIADGSVTNTEFQYLGSVTSDIQTQLNAKLDDSQFDGVAKITVGTTTPVGPAVGDLWIDIN